jgi:hypothetical protein
MRRQFAIVLGFAAHKNQAGRRQVFLSTNEIRSDSLSQHLKGTYPHRFIHNPSGRHLQQKLYVPTIDWYIE